MAVIAVTSAAVKRFCMVVSRAGKERWVRAWGRHAAAGGPGRAGSGDRDARQRHSGVAEAQEVVEAEDAADGDGHEGGVQELQGRVEVGHQPARRYFTHQN